MKYFLLPGIMLASGAYGGEEPKLPDGWKRYSINDRTCTIRMPATPRAQLIQVPTDRNLIKVMLYKADYSTAKRHIVFTVMKQPLRVFRRDTPKRIFDEFLIGFAKASRGKAVRRKDGTTGKHSSRDFLYNLAGGVSQVRGRLLLVGNELYCLSAIGTGIADDPLIEAFCNSLEFAGSD